MNKKIYLTFDIETIVSGLSYNPTFHASVVLGGLYIAHELKKRNLKGTFYISLSPKAKEIPFAKYIDAIDLLVDGLKGFDNIKIEPHLHACALPVTFKCEEDKFSSYNKKQQMELLNWSKNYFEGHGISVSNFRPGGYNVNDSYYEALFESGFSTSSVLCKDEKTLNIDLLTGKSKEYFPYMTNQGIKEYPVTSVKIKSIKPGVTEIINLSPDFLILDSVKKYIDELNYVNINFHSFSMFNNRLARENHRHQNANNFKFLFYERWASKLLRSTKIETVKHETLFYEEFIRWSDYIHEKQYETFFIGE